VRQAASPGGVHKQQGWKNIFTTQLISAHTGLFCLQQQEVLDKMTLWGLMPSSTSSIAIIFSGARTPQAPLFSQ
jgi:hypothetical protein